jgi:hypothetical protein
MGSLPVCLYQLAFMTPGISPFSESDRKQMRHMLNLRRNARGRPQRGQRLFFRDVNFAVRLARAICDFFATGVLPYCRNGTPIERSSARPSTSFPAVVTNAMFIPVTFDTRS